ncbi:MAG: hypothetical protein MJ124_09470 [Lachnospiraceae bacterium]|nr:hypothetical protein [Lachnospiraceae bacterium]
MKEKKVNIYIDMDGVQAVYGFEDSLEDMYQPGYFRNRPSYENMIEVIKLLKEDPRYDVTVLSAVFPDGSNTADKQIWLKEQGLGDVAACFVPYGSVKADYADPERVNILIDDFSKNLFEWEDAGKNFYGIKFLNEGNGTNGTWDAAGGFTVNYRMPKERLHMAITGLADAIGKAA